MAEVNHRFVVLFSGNVQGVGFRANALSQARGLDLRGFVRNEANGSVRLDIVGARKDVNELIRRIKSSMAGNIDTIQLDQFDPEQRPPGFRIQLS